MTWTLIRWVWRLEAPLFIGMPPAGTLNRCRLYVPARAVHGAVTAELARLNGNEKNTFPDYGKFGREVGLNCRFTYLYPVEKIGGNYHAWLPDFKTKGLHWCRQDGKENLSDRDFRRCLLDSRPGTAIAPETDSASEGTLRETECVNSRWHPSSNGNGESGDVFLMGYVFLKNNCFNGNSKKYNGVKPESPKLRDIQTLFVGGDTRYGLGKMCRVGDLSESRTVFGKSVHLDKENPEIQSNIVWGHALEDDQTPIQGIQGMKELLGGWEIDKVYNGKLAWTPGSSMERSVDWSIDNYGFWEIKS